MKKIILLIFILAITCFAQFPKFPRFPRFLPVEAITDKDSTIVDTIDAGRTYQTVAAWINAYKTTDFVTRKIIVKGVIHDSLTITKSINFPRNTTDASHYWWLTGGKLINNGLDSNHTIGMINANATHIKISNVEINMGAQPTVAIWVDSSTAWIYNNKIHNGHGTATTSGDGYASIKGINCTGSYVGSVYYIWNNIIYDLNPITPFDNANESVGMSFTGLVQKRYIYNNTVYDIGDSVYSGFSAGMDFESNGTGTEFYVYNNVMMNCYDKYTAPAEINDFMIGACNNISTKIFAYNLSSDTTAHDGMGGTMTDYYVINVVDSNVFSDPSTFDLKLAAGSPAINEGLTLTDQFQNDFTGAIRGLYGTWDLGAYECTSNCTVAPSYIAFNVGKYNVGVYGK